MVVNNKMVFLVQGKNDYYVYRLIDPRTLQTFYVGKGTGNRAEQHAKHVKQLIANGDDPVSMKEQQIADIIAAGKEVIVMIHRRGLTEKEAFEVEAALIDAYPGLTNVQGGYGIDRGMILLQDIPSTQPYAEPAEGYVIIKVRPSSVQQCGSLYYAVHEAWKVGFNKIKNIKYVVAAVSGVVREVYEVNNWYKMPNDPQRVGFNGAPTAKPNMTALKGKLLPSYYTKKGASNPVLYKK